MKFSAIQDIKEVLLEKWDAAAKSLSLPPLRIPSLDALPGSGEGHLLNVPQFQQIDRFSCGFIAGWAVIKTLYPERGLSDGRSFYASCNPDVEMGPPPSRLVKALRTHGVRVGLRSGQVTFPVLKKALRDGCPVIACIDRPTKDYAHWATVYGYSETKKAGRTLRSLYLHNNGLPLPGKREDRVMEFERFRGLCMGSFLICRRKN